VKSIPLKVVSLKAPGVANESDLKFAEAIPAILAMKQGGMPVDEMRKVMRVSDACDAAFAEGRETLLLEDADWTYVKMRMEAHSFPFGASAFVDLVDAVTNAKTVEVEVAKRAESGATAVREAVASEVAETTGITSLKGARKAKAA
jgi:hypothetical protein